MKKKKKSSRRSSEMCQELESLDSLTPQAMESEKGGVSSVGYRDSALSEADHYQYESTLSKSLSGEATNLDEAAAEFVDAGKTAKAIADYQQAEADWSRAGRNSDSASTAARDFEHAAHDYRELGGSQNDELAAQFDLEAGYNWSESHQPDAKQESEADYYKAGKFEQNLAGQSMENGQYQQAQSEYQQATSDFNNAGAEGRAHFEFDKEMYTGIKDANEANSGVSLNTSTRLLANAGEAFAAAGDTADADYNLNQASIDFCELAGQAVQDGNVTEFVHRVLEAQKLATLAGETSKEAAKTIGKWLLDNVGSAAMTDAVQDPAGDDRILDAMFKQDLDQDLESDNVTGLDSVESLAETASRASAEHSNIFDNIASDAAQGIHDIDQIDAAQAAEEAESAAGSGAATGAEAARTASLVDSFVEDINVLEDDLVDG